MVRALYKTTLNGARDYFHPGFRDQAPRAGSPRGRPRRRGPRARPQGHGRANPRNPRHLDRIEGRRDSRSCIQGVQDTSLLCIGCTLYRAYGALYSVCRTFRPTMRKGCGLNEKGLRDQAWRADGGRCGSRAPPLWRAGRAAPHDDVPAVYFCTFLHHDVMM